MKTTRPLRPIRLAAATLLTALACSAQAASFESTWNPAGYATVGFTVEGPQTVDMVYTGGWADATFSLFDSTGAHLYSNDDSNGVYPRITLALDSGAYSLLVSYCCQAFEAVFPGSEPVGSDGVSDGYFLRGGPATLAGTTAWLDSLAVPGADFADQAYALTISNATLSPSAVPEPAPAALLGVGLAAGLAASGLARRRASLCRST